MAELYDIVAANQRATQVGAALGGQMFNNSVRAQQLQSEQALQKLQQQQAAEMLSWTMRQHHEAIDAEADNAKRSAAFQAMITPTLSVPSTAPIEGHQISPTGFDTGVTLPNESGQATNTAQVANPAYTPNWGEAYFKAMAGSKVPIAQVATTAGVLALHQAQTAMDMQKAKDEAAANASGPGSIQQATGNFEGAPKLNVFVPPKGRGAVQLVGDEQLKTIVGADGRTYQIGKDGSVKPLAATPQQQANARSQGQALATGLKVDASKVTRNPDGSYSIDPEAWASIQKQSQVSPELRTKLEGEMAKSRQTISNLQELRATLRPEDVGVKGVFGSALLDTWLPQLGVDSADVARMDNRTKLMTFNEAMLRQMTDDTKFSNTDRADLKRIQPSPGVAESYPHAMQTASTLEQIFAKKSLITADTMGKPAPTWAIGALTKPKLLEAFKAGLLDEQALLDAQSLGKLTEQEAGDLFNQLHSKK